MIKISDVPLAMQYMSGNKIGKFICLRKMSSLESFHGCYLHETYSHNSHCTCTEICLELLEKLPLKKKANRGSIFACWLRIFASAQKVFAKL